MSLYRFFWPSLFSPPGVAELNRYSRTTFFNAISVIAAGVLVGVCLILATLQVSPDAAAAYTQTSAASLLQTAGAFVTEGLGAIVAVEAFITNHYLHLVAFIALSFIEVTACVRTTNALYQLRKSGLHLTDEGYAQATENASRVRYTDIVQGLAFTLLMLSTFAWAAKAVIGAAPDWELTAITVLTLTVLWLFEPAIVLRLLNPEIREFFKEAKLAAVGNYVSRRLRLHDNEAKYLVVFRNDCCESAPLFLSKLITEERNALANNRCNTGVNNG